jgi:hypothetical protein
MAPRKIISPKDVVERNIALVGDVMKYLINQVDIFASLPDNFELIILPDDDPEIRQYNLDLLSTFGSEGKPVVFARINRSPKLLMGEENPTLYVPVAV